MATPHNSAALGDFAKTVLMPGDPLRAKFIAETFLENAKLVNNVRGIQGYTGSYKGTPVSVMASGMGMPSIGIYSYELFTMYGVDNIIRIGSAGAISPELKLRDVVAAMGACTNSNYASQYRLPGTFAPICNYELLSFATEAAKELGVRMPVGNLFSSDTFYDAAASSMEWAKMGCLAVEMQRGLHPQARPGHLLDFGQHRHGRGAGRRGAAEQLHQHDEDRAGNRRQGDEAARPCRLGQHRIQVKAGI